MEKLLIIPILLFSVVIHEIAHGWAALKCGDPTAKMAGRLSLNPFPHMELFGSVILPLFFILTNSSLFLAWAKPVPVDPSNFKNYKRDDILVSAAGPISNFILAFFCTVIFIILEHLNLGDSLFIIYLKKMFLSGISLNVVLAVFNLIPIPPLDGSHIAASILPESIGEQYRKIGFIGVLIILFILQVPAIRVIFRNIIEFFIIPYEFILNLFL